MTTATMSMRLQSISMTTILFMGLSISLLWAAIFEIDQSVRAQGQIIPSSRTQIIQAADGGVLSEILVHEGEHVTAGQLLAVLEKDRPSAAFEESRARTASLTAALTRAQAEATGRELRFDHQLDGYPEFAEVQRALYRQRKLGLEQEVAALTDSLDAAQEELRMNTSLFETGDASRLDVLRATRQVVELEGKISAVRNKYLQEARQESSKLEEELSSNRYKLEERRSMLDHTDLTTPVAGIVKYMRVTTVGGVLRAGDELMQISPTGGEMVLEAKINPADIGPLRLGLPVSVRLDAFDYSIYGALRGTLSYLSADTLSEQGANGQVLTYYRAQIRISPDEAKANPRLAEVALKPGMTATADIRTGTRSVLQYLAKPVFKAFSGAMSER